MKLTHTLLALPIMGACAMGVHLWRFSMVGTPLSVAAIAAFVALAILYLAPFGFAFHMTIQGAQPGRWVRLVVGACFSLLLGYLPVMFLTDPVDGEVLGYMVVLFPVYMWSVVAVLTLIGIGADAIAHLLRQSTSNKVRS